MPPPLCALSASLPPAAPEAPTIKAPRAASEAIARIPERERAVIRLLGEDNAPLPVVFRRARDGPAHFGIEFAISTELCQRSRRYASAQCSSASAELRRAVGGQSVGRVSGDLFRRLVVHDDGPDDISAVLDQPLQRLPVERRVVRGVEPQAGELRAAVAVTR